MSRSPSLYRRHRPRSFAEVVGQEHVVRTLANAVDRDMVHHAYLFVGSRGTGKTSMAKILAACLNCASGPTTSPCGECESCVSIAAASSLDVIEMDAASSNSVDDIRALRESVAYAPVSGGRKVYILDEAHMLSTAAWNAFLKTLEEPPPNTVFVLATTEAQKVLPTVIDRCHRFDFQRPTADQIATVLRRAAAAEGIAIPPGAVALLARHAAGSFRDALGTLEQLRTYAGDEILLEDVLAVLGVADAEHLFAVVDAVADGDQRAALLAVAACVDGGRDPAGFIRELELHLREALVVATLGGEVPAEVAITPERDARLVEQAARVPGATLVRLLDLLAAALAAVRAGADGRTQLELAVIKAAAPSLDPTARALLERLARLEAAVAGRGVPARPPLNGAATPVAAAGPPVEAAAAASVRAARTAGPDAEPDPAAAAGDAGPQIAAADGEAGPQIAAAAGEAGPQIAAAAGDAGLDVVAADEAAGDVVAPLGDPAASGGAPAGESDRGAALEPGPPAGALTLERVAALWPAVLEVVGATNKMLAAVVAEAVPVELSARRLVVAFPSPFHRSQADDKDKRATLVEALRAVTGESIALDYSLRELEPSAVGPAAPLSEEEWVARLKAEFDAEELDG